MGLNFHLVLRAGMVTGTLVLPEPSNTGALTTDFLNCFEPFCCNATLVEEEDAGYRLLL
jgi:hypothetical protein